MDKFSLLSEYLKRDISKNLKKKSLDKQIIATNRLVFLKRLHDSDGTYLLDFVSISDSPSLIKTKDVFSHIKNKANTTFSKRQISYISSFLEKIGAIMVKRTDYYYFKNVRLKD